MSLSTNPNFTRLLEHLQAQGVAAHQYRRVGFSPPALDKSLGGLKPALLMRPTVSGDIAYLIANVGLSRNASVMLE